MEEKEGKKRKRMVIAKRLQSEAAQEREGKDDSLLIVENRTTIWYALYQRLVHTVPRCGIRHTKLWRLHTKLWQR